MHKLSETSALVLLWALEGVYESDAAKQYLEKLDLAEGKALNKACTNIWPYYGEVILNRKFGILHLCQSVLAQDSAAAQIIIAGAGLDAMGIELAARFPECRIFEIDWENMDIKKELAANTGCIFISAELQDAKNCKQALEEEDWSPDMPTILILEGITYYLQDRALEKLCTQLAPTMAIAEYIKHTQYMTKQARQISRDVFATIQAYCGIEAIRPYDAAELAAMIGLPMADLWSMQRLEAARLGQNTHFPTTDSGWIEIGLFHRQ